MTTWILVGDASRAKLFTVELPEQPWSLVEEFENASAHVTSKELSPTAPGKTKMSGSTRSRHTALEPRTTPKEAELERFVQRLVDHLQLAAARREFDRLVLVAPPHFLGLVHAKLDKQTARQLAATIDKDLVMLADREIRERLSDEVFAQ
ncbi:MAG: host attachment protein [Pirellulales bacterium]